MSAPRNNHVNLSSGDPVAIMNFYLNDGILDQTEMLVVKSRINNTSHPLSDDVLQKANALLEVIKKGEQTTVTTEWFNERLNTTKTVSIPAYKASLAVRAQIQDYLKTPRIGSQLEARAVYSCVQTPSEQKLEVNGIRENLVPKLIEEAKEETPDGCTYMGFVDPVLTVTIGLFGPTTGNLAAWGTMMQRGLELAVTKATNEEATPGIKIKPIIYDDQGDNSHAAGVTQRLVSQDGVSVLIGGATSGLTLAASPIAEGARVPIISPQATNPEVTVRNGRTRSYVFRACFTDDFQGTVLARFVIKELKAQRIAILEDTSSSYSRGIVQVFLGELARLGVTSRVVAHKSYQDSDVDFKPQLTSIRGETPDVIFVPDSNNRIGLMSRQIQELGIKASIVGGDGWDQAGFLDVGSTSLVANPFYFSNHYAFNASTATPESQAFVAAYQASYRGNPDATALLTYDTARMVIGAIATTNGGEPQAIRDALENTRDFPGASGTITINAQHDAIKPAVILKIVDKDPGEGVRLEYDYVTTVKPD